MTHHAYHAHHRACGLVGWAWLRRTRLGVRAVFGPQAPHDHLHTMFGAEHSGAALGFAEVYHSAPAKVLLAITNHSHQPACLDPRQCVLRLHLERGILQELVVL